MMGLLVIVLLAVVVALVLFARGAKRVGQDTKAEQDGLLASKDSLRYTVPAGQDPAVVVAELHKAGFAAAEDPRSGGLTGGTSILIDVEDGRPDRERVRALLEQVDRVNLDGDPPAHQGRPRFSDE